MKQQTQCNCEFRIRKPYVWNKTYFSNMCAPYAI